MGGNGTALAKLDTATRMLAEAKTLDEVKQVRDIAEAARVYARAAKLGLEAYNHAAEVKVRAERKAGEMLVRLEKKPGQRTDKQPPNITLGGSEYRQVLIENDINEMTSSRWQQIAQMPEQIFEARIEEMRGEKPITTSGVLREIQETKRENHYAEMTQAGLLAGKYRVFYADPPWKYNDSGVVTDSDAYGRAERHYPTMSIDELCLLPIKEMVEDDAVLFLWVTSPLLEDSFKVIKAWGFEYKTSFVWDKVKHNFGHYNSVRHEFLLVCTRGSCTPDHLELFDSVQSIERSEKHSEKPQEFVDIIETLYTYGGKIELFARQRRDGWKAWGNESAT